MVSVQVVRFKVKTMNEEQGQIFRTPCKVGDFVYQLDRQHNKIITRKVARIECIISNRGCEIEVFFEIAGSCREINFGNTVFTSNQNALQALEGKQ